MAHPPDPSTLALAFQPSSNAPDVSEPLYACPEEVESWGESPKFKNILFGWAVTFYSNRRERFQRGFRKEMKRLMEERNITEAAAWQLFRNGIANELVSLLGEEHYRNGVHNMSAQGLIDNEKSNYQDCFIVAAYKLVIDGTKFDFADALLERLKLRTPTELLTDDEKQKAADLKNCYAQALDLLWSLLQDLERDCPLLGQPVAAPRASYFRKLLNLEPVRVPRRDSSQGTQYPSQSIYDNLRECWSVSERDPDDSSDTDDPLDSSRDAQTAPQDTTAVTLFPFKVDTFIALWKRSLQTGASSNMLRMIMDPAIVQHLLRFKMATDRVRYEKELRQRGNWSELRGFFAWKLRFIDPSTQPLKSVRAQLGRGKGWMKAWLWTTHDLVTDGAKYLTPGGTLPPPQDEAELEALRAVCLELLHCVYLGLMAYPGGYWGSNLDEPRERPRQKKKKATRKKPARSTYEYPQVPRQPAPRAAAAGAGASQLIDLPDLTGPEDPAANEITSLRLQTAFLQAQGEILANEMITTPASWDERVFVTFKRVERELGQPQPDDLEGLRRRAEVLQMQNETLAEAVKAMIGPWDRRVSETLRVVGDLRESRVQALLSEPMRTAVTGETLIN